jgi:peptide/nickel transport system permease protein
LVQAIIVLFGVILLVFVLAHIVPGGAARAALGSRATPGQIASYNRLNGYDLPIWDQLYQYVKGIVTSLDLGYSYKMNEPVKNLILERLPKTLVLVGISTAFAVIVAVPLGVLQVVRRGKVVDYAATGLSFIFYAMPAFLLGSLLIMYFAIDLHWFPVSAPSASSIGGLLSDPRGIVLPVLTLAALTIAQFSRYMRSSLMETMQEDYVRTARAKGAGSRRVLYLHALRNALIPIITLLGLTLPGIVSGAFITESLFNWPGMGLLTVNAAFNDDVPLLLGTTIVITIATVVGSLLADILYAVVDPRVRYA